MYPILIFLFPRVSHNFFSLFLPANGLLRSWRHARSSDAFKDLFDFSGTASEWIIPKSVGLVFDQFDERDQKTPRMRPMKDQPFQKDSCDLLLDSYILALAKQVQHHAGKVMSMAGRVPELVGNRIQANVPATIIKVHELLKDIHFKCTDARKRNLRGL